MKTASRLRQRLLRVVGWTCAGAVFGLAAGAFYFVLQTWLEGEPFRDNLVLLPEVLRLGLYVGIPSGFFYGLYEAQNPSEAKRP